VVLNGGRMRRTLILLGCLAGTLAVPAVALGMLSEVGLTPSQLGAANPRQPTPSCPGSPCLAVSQTTGFQVKVGSDRGPLTIPRNGSIVAWTITLGSPTAAQTTYFNTNEGGAAEAGIAILRPVGHLAYRLVGQSALVALKPYFGEAAQFALATSIPVRKGDQVALTVPTWAPALALGFGNDTSWRASRAKGGCTTTSSQTAQTTVGASATYYCLYQTARLTYSATLVSTP
jgi:hypothetical protein